MKVHHLNAATLCPPGTCVIPGEFPRETVCHCLLVETPRRLVLVDTGLGTRDLEHPRRLGAMRWGMNPKRDRAETAVAAVQSLGFAPEDVSDIVLTHLDLDHAGGIADFPDARVHVHRDEWEAANRRAALSGRLRYRPAHTASIEDWHAFDLDTGESWKGFDCVRGIDGLPPELLLVRLPGHSAGHFGVAVDVDEKWLLHAGDTYYDRDELLTDRSATLLGRWAQRVIHHDFPTARKTLERLRDIAEDDDLIVFCSHDCGELRRLRTR